MRIKPQIVTTRDNVLSDLLEFDLDVVHARIIDLREICEEYKNDINEHTKSDKITIAAIGGGDKTIGDGLSVTNDMKDYSTSTSKSNIL